jgi:hypothetical protein
MEKGIFEYRVVFIKSEGYFLYKLFKKNEKYYFISKFPHIPYGNSIETLNVDLSNIKSALDKSTLLYEDIEDMSKMPLDPISY